MIPFFHKEVYVQLYKYEFRGIVRVVFRLGGIIGAVRFGSIGGDTLTYINFQGVGFLCATFLHLSCRKRGSISSSSFSQGQGLTSRYAIKSITLGLVRRCGGYGHGQRVMGESFFFSVNENGIRNRVYNEVSRSTILWYARGSILTLARNNI